MTDRLGRRHDDVFVHLTTQPYRTCDVIQPYEKVVELSFCFSYFCSKFSITILFFYNLCQLYLEFPFFIKKIHYTTVKILKEITLKKKTVFSPAANIENKTLLLHCM